jgi:hypothetical protein
MSVGHAIRHLRCVSIAWSRVEQNLKAHNNCSLVWEPPPVPTTLLGGTHGRKHFHNYSKMLFASVTPVFSNVYHGTFQRLNNM